MVACLRPSSPFSEGTKSTTRRHSNSCVAILQQLLQNSLSRTFLKKRCTMGSRDPDHSRRVPRSRDNKCFCLVSSNKCRQVSRFAGKPWIPTLYQLPECWQSCSSEALCPIVVGLIWIKSSPNFLNCRHVVTSRASIGS